jgi:DNA-binding FadR family transcriptional regulator
MKPAARSSLATNAADLLREQISSGAWPVGTKIPVEAKLAGMLEISRGTVREAVKTLAASGLLEVRQGDGTYVRSRIDPVQAVRRLRHSSLRDQFEARLALEVEAARLAAVRHRADQIGHFHALLDARGNWDAGDDKAAFVARDYAFHLAVVAASGNPALVQLYQFFSESVNETIASTLDEDIPEPDMAAHRSIIHGIASRDPDQADKAVRAFMTPVFQTLTNLLTHA